MQSWKKRGQRKRGNAQHTPMRGITRRRGPNVTRRNNASINPTKAKRKSISFSPVSSLNWTWTGKLRSHLSKILGISYSSIKTMTFQWESALELSSIVETHYTTDFSRILPFASDESLKISLPTYTSWWQDLFLSLSLLPREKNVEIFLCSAWSLSGEWKHWPPIKLRGYPACRNWREAKKRARGI